MLDRPLVATAGHLGRLTWGWIIAPAHGEPRNASSTFLAVLTHLLNVTPCYALHPYNIRRSSNRSALVSAEKHFLLLG